MNTAKTEFVGRHEHRFEPPDRVHIVMHGTIDAREIDEQNAIVCKFHEQCGKRLRVICYLADFDGMTTDARQYIVRMNREYPFVGIAFVGGSFMTRTVASTVIRAGQLLAPQHFQFPMFFGKIPQECEQWLDGLDRSSKNP